MSRPRVVAAVVILAVGLLVIAAQVVVAIDGVRTETNNATPPGPVPTGSASGPPVPETFEDYRRRCEQLDRLLLPERVIYARELTMERGVSTLVAAAVSVDRSTPASKVIEGAPSVDDSVAVRVSCQVEAQLAGDPAVFVISDTTWQSRSLLTSPTATWYWFVTPRRGGDQALVLNVRPIVRVERVTGTSTLGDVPASTETFGISVAVGVPMDQAAAEVLGRIEGFLLSLEGLLTAIAGVVVSGLALWRFRRGGTGRAAGTGQVGQGS